MKNPSPNNPFTWLCIALALVVISATMDGPTEAEAAQDVADYSAALADGGVSLCAEFGRVPTWTKAGDLVCRAPMAVAQGDTK